MTGTGLKLAHGSRLHRFSCCLRRFHVKQYEPFFRDKKDTDAHFLLQNSCSAPSLFCIKKWGFGVQFGGVMVIFAICTEIALKMA